MKILEATYVIANEKLVVKYGFTEFKGQLSYFSITGELSKSHRFVAVGCVHDEIAKFAEPGIVKLIKWHLCDINGQPMHYIANAMYFWGLFVGTIEPSKYDNKTKEQWLEIFKSQIVFGEVAGDAKFLAPIDNGELLAIDYTEIIKVWLEGRKGALKMAIERDMKEVGLLS